METTNRFYQFAKLLLEIYVESGACEDYPDVEMPDVIIKKTARIIEQDFNSGELEENEDGSLYNIDCVDNYCGLYEKYFEMITDNDYLK